jgi:serine/threonine-protein kinase RsbW
MSADDRISLLVPSRVDHLDLIQATAEQLARLAGCSAAPQLDFGLAVREGAVNAMKHAHRLNPSQFVRLEFRCSTGFIEVSIVDHGPGFDPATLPDPRVPENLLSSSGRGLFLIRSLVDQVHFIQHDDGMELILRKRLNGAATSR